MIMSNIEHELIHTARECIRLQEEFESAKSNLDRIKKQLKEADENYKIAFEKLTKEQEERWKDLNK